MFDFLYTYSIVILFYLFFKLKMSTLTFLLLFVFVLAIPAVSYFFYKRSTDQKVQAFLEQNPYAAKVYLPLFSRSGIHSVSVRISLVDGEVPVTFMEGFKT